MDFIPSASVIAAFSIAAAILALTPGPDMTLFVSRALTQGRAAGFAAMTGAYCGIVVHTLLAAFGLSALLAASPNAFLAVKVAGALYLVWLAVQALRHGSALTLERQDKPRQALLQTWLTGIGINLLNPKIVLFFVTFLPQFVSAGDPDAAGKLAFLGLYFMVVSLPITSVMVFTADKFSALLRKSRRVTRTLDYLFAGIFGTFAAKILLTRSG